ncbi:hypothetical protein Tco_0714504 [Tanacetum coccineum]
MGDKNPIRTLGDYFKPSHEGYRNTIELPVGNNVVPLRSDTIRLVQNRCSFYGLLFEDLNQHLRNFLKLVDSLELDGDNRERTHYLSLKTKGDDPDNTKKPTETGMKMPVKEVETKDEAENRPGNESIKTPESEEVVKAPGSQPVAYYLKHKINENLIKGLVNNNRFNNSLSGTRVRKKKKKEYNVLPRGPVYEAILKKKITKKEDIGGNFKIPCSIGGLKHVNALVDQGSDVNVMPYSTYMKLTNDHLLRLTLDSQCSHSEYSIP